MGPADFLMAGSPWSENNDRLALARTCPWASRPADHRLCPSSRPHRIRLGRPPSTTSELIHPSLHGFRDRSERISRRPRSLPVPWTYQLNGVLMKGPASRVVGRLTILISSTTEKTTNKSPSPCFRLRVAPLSCESQISRRVPRNWPLDFHSLLFYTREAFFGYHHNRRIRLAVRQFLGRKVFCLRQASHEGAIDLWVTNEPGRQRELEFFRLGVACPGSLAAQP
jgi:hypothetical protein